MDYWQNLKDSLKTTWQHKYLWAIGLIFAIFSGGSSGSSSNNNHSGEVRFDQGEFNNGLIKIQDFLHQVPLLLWLLLALTVFVLILLISLLCIYLKSRAQAALIASTVEIEKQKQLNFGNAWKLGRDKMKALSKQNLLLAIPAYFAFIVIFIIFFALLVKFYNANSLSNEFFNFSSRSSSYVVLLIGSSSFLLLFLCGYVIFAIIFAFAQAFGSKFAVLEGQSAISSLKSGLRFFSSNFGKIFVSWLIMILVDIALLILAALFIIPIFLLLVLFIGFANPITYFLSGIIILIFIPISLIFTGFNYAWSEVYWTKVYLRIKEMKGK
ncbi:MAG: hypothetical protein WCJ58_03535 [bacterium]